MPLVRLQKIGRKINAKEEQARRQCTHEIKAMFHRWEEESDLDSEQILECMADAVNEYYEEEIVDFIDEMDGELDLGET